MRATTPKSIISPKQGRGTRKWPTGRYRRMMKRDFPRRIYAQRCQREESVVIAQVLVAWYGIQ